MYANRYHSTASRPAGAGGALLISGAMILGLYFAGPTIAPGVFRTPPIVIDNIPIETPKPADPKPQPQNDRRKTVTTPLPHVPDRAVRWRPGRSHRYRRCRHDRSADRPPGRERAAAAW